MQIGLARAFPRSRIVPIGSHSRGTAIAVHSHIDFLAVLPSEWAIWGARRMSPLKIIHRMTEHLSEFAPAVRRDGRGVELYFDGVTCAVDVVPGFLVRATDRYPVYSLPGEDNQWIEASPEWHIALFSHANARSGAKLRSIAQLIKIWQFAGSPPFEISGLYIDMMLAISDIAAGIKSYGQCLCDFFEELVRQENPGSTRSRRRVWRDCRKSVERCLRARVRCGIGRHRACASRSACPSAWRYHQPHAISDDQYSVAGNGRGLRASFSAGLATRTKNDQSLNEVITAVDAAVYEAKNGGRNLVRLDHETYRVAASRVLRALYGRA